ncbi:serine protease [Streptomyces sp. NPDC017940]|uniref:serine protease n=1 Tax=Streptomyces sp. NPDC017940 TaxID=3365017 RepID=UPI0037938745
MSDDAESGLRRLTRDALVQLRPEGGDGMWGSGFFVAPGWILTCAHVLAPHLGQDPATPFRVQGDGLAAGEPRPARLEAWLVDDDPLARVPPDQDLALVRLTAEEPHPSVWLSDRPARLPERFVVAGYRRTAEGGTARACEADARRVTGQGPYGVRVTGVLPSGACGGPAVDPVTGGVVALARARDRRTGTSFLVSTTALHRFGALARRVLAAHDVWHAHRAARDARDWVAVQRKLPGGLVVSGDQWSPRDRSTALALLAALRPPPSARAVTETLRAASGEDLCADAQPPPRSWRDGHGLLYGPDATPAAVYLRYLHLVARYGQQTEPDDEAARRLLAWVRERTGEVSLFLRPLVADASVPDSLRPAGAAGARPFPARGDGRPVVTVELEPVYYARSPRVYWRVGIDHGHGDRVPLDEDNRGEGVPVADVVARLARPLAEAFRRVDLPEQPAPLEVALRRRGAERRRQGARRRRAALPASADAAADRRARRRSARPRPDAPRRRVRRSRPAGTATVLRAAPADRRGHRRAAPGLGVRALAAARTALTRPDPHPRGCQADGHRTSSALASRARTAPDTTAAAGARRVARRFD